MLETADKIEENGRKFRLLTPFVPQKHVSSVLNLIENFSKEKNNTEITINDYGILYACQRLSHAKDNRFTLGHFLSQTTEESPWHENILRDESEAIKETYLRCNMENKRRMEVCKKWGVHCIESAMFPHTSGHFREIRDLGVEILVFLDYYQIAFGRRCPVAKFYDIEIPGCFSKCDEVLKLQLKLMYDKATHRPMEPSEEARKDMPELYVCGNVAFAKIKPNMDLRFVNVIAFDYRLYSKDEMSKRIKDIRG